MVIKLNRGDRIPNTRLSYIEERPKINNRRQARFKCDCGSFIETDLHWVRFLDITSCGCYKSEIITKKNTKHSNAKREYKTGAYRSWQAMHQRVKKDPYYKNKIFVCERWSGKDGFKNFLKDMGERPDGFTLERKNNSKGYEPENCIWADWFVQNNNKGVK